MVPVIARSPWSLKYGVLQKLYKGSLATLLGGEQVELCMPAMKAQRKPPKSAGAAGETLWKEGH